MTKPSEDERNWVWWRITYTHDSRVHRVARLPVDDAQGRIAYDPATKFDGTGRTARGRDIPEYPSSSIHYTSAPGP